MVGVRRWKKFSGASQYSDNRISRSDTWKVSPASNLSMLNEMSTQGFAAASFTFLPLDVSQTIMQDED